MRKINKIIILIIICLFVSMATGYCYIDYFESHNSICKLRIPMTGRQGALQRVLKLFHRYKPEWTFNKQRAAEEVIEYKPESDGIKIYEVSEEHLEGERTAELFYDNEIWAKLPPAVKEKIKRIISEYPDHWQSEDYNEKSGEAKDKRAVKINLDEPIIINGEEINAIVINGILFKREELGKEYLGASWGGSRERSVRDLSKEELENAARVEFDIEGRPVFSKPFFQQLGGLDHEEARAKFAHSIKTLPEAGLKGPVAVGYAKYLGLKKDNRNLGVFISASRKEEPERYGIVINNVLTQYYEEVEQAIRTHLLKALGGGYVFIDSGGSDLEIAMEVGKKYDFGVLYRAYGKALRLLNDAGFYPKDPHTGNMALDLSGEKPTIWYDTGMWKVANDLTKAQRLAQRYWTLTYGSMNVSRDIGTPGLTLACMCKLVNPDYEFLKGYFYDKLDDPLFNLSDFKIYRYGRNSLQYALLDPDDNTPVHLRKSAPFIPLLCAIEGFEGLSNMETHKALFQSI
ncbi:MAG: hypothetical protein Q8N76_04100 [Candidatus Omnitrophota bacterium]|nr:hypothetical protein [Candidatus Omnitrophota bacterium]